MSFFSRESWLLRYNWFCASLATEGDLVPVLPLVVVQIKRDHVPPLLDANALVPLDATLALVLREENVLDQRIEWTSNQIQNRPRPERINLKRILLSIP